MANRKKISNKWNSLLFNHLWLKFLVDYGSAFFLSVLSAAIFAFGFRTFIKPADIVGKTMVSGGASGFSQVIQLISEILGFKGNIVEIVYVVANIPIIILAFKGIGKRFGFFTLVNVGFVAIFSTLFEKADFIIALSNTIQNDTGMIGRSLFAGLCTGMSSAIAFKIESSAGGFDVVSYYLSLKKGTNTGPYIAFINGAILLAFTVLSSISGQNTWPESIAGCFVSIVYLFTVTLLIDIINVRNKKAQVEVITDDEKLPDLLLSHIPHGATVLRGKGVYSGKEHIVVHMVVSINEVKRVVDVAKALDSNSFINVTSLQQVYGHFHMKTIK